MIKEKKKQKNTRRLILCGTLKILGVAKKCSVYVVLSVSLRIGGNNDTQENYFLS